MNKFIVLFVALTLIAALFVLVTKSRESLQLVEPNTNQNY